MCQKKPGPRCSREAGKAMEKASAAYFAASDAYFSDDDAIPGTIDKQERKYQLAKASYMATPEGLKELKADLTDPDAEVTYLPEDISLKEGSVNLVIDNNLPMKTNHDILINSATNFRNWQKNTLKTLTSLPDNQVDGYVKQQTFVLTQLRKKAIDENIAIKEEIDEQRYLANKNGLPWLTPEDPHHHDLLTKALKNGMQEKYLSIAINDIKAYKR